VIARRIPIEDEQLRTGLSGEHHVSTVVDKDDLSYVESICMTDAEHERAIDQIVNIDSRHAIDSSKYEIVSYGEHQ
jgi:hypothetical protein